MASVGAKDIPYRFPLPFVISSSFQSLRPNRALPLLLAPPFHSVLFITALLNIDET